MAKSRKSAAKKSAAKSSKVEPTITLGHIESLWGDSIAPDDTPGMTIKRRRDTVRAPSQLNVKTHSIEKAGRAGDVPPDYELSDLLGEGGMGLVYEARQTSIDRSIALKMIKGKSPDAKTNARFLSEAAVIGDLDHPNIIPIYDLGENSKRQLFYTMKRVQGRPWDEVMEEKDLDENLDILMRVADALAFAHSKGVLHRDLKPENVMLGEFGEVLLMDWGLAAAAPEATGSKAEKLDRKNAAGGTPAYMAPEMALGDVSSIGIRSDVYLLGSVLFKIITGKPPHTGNSALNCIYNASINKIRPTEEKGQLMQIAMHAMATEPENRHATVKEFQKAVRGYRAKTEVVQFWRKVDLLVGSGISLLDTLEYAEQEVESYGLKQAISGLMKNLADGRDMSDAMTDHPTFFSPSVIRMIRIAEKTGTFDKMCAKIADGLESGALAFRVAPTDPEGIRRKLRKDVQDEGRSSPIVALVDDIIRETYESGASDVHLEATSSGMRVRCRIDGLLKEVRTVEQQMTRGLINRLKAMAQLDVAERRLPQDGKIKWKNPDDKGMDLELRICTSPVAGSREDVVMRILAEARSVPFDRLGLGEDVSQSLDKALQSPYGLLLCVGPTGSGLTTTMYSLMSRVERPEIKVLSAEDPVQMYLDGVSQVPVKRKIGYTFDTAVRVFLRQDPDVIVTEMPDPNTASTCVQAALGGHLVIASLHPNTAAETIRRLLDMEIERIGLSEALIGILAQRLVRCLCDKCREPYTPDEGELAAAGMERSSDGEVLFLGKTHPAGFNKKVGCERCRQTGYRGRMGLFEFMPCDGDIKQAIIANAKIDELVATARRAGMRRLQEDGFLKVIQGLTDFNEVRRVCAGSM